MIPIKKHYHIVFTTIFHPIVLDKLYQNIKKHKHLAETKILVVGDRKTPESIRALCAKLTKRGLETEYMDIAAQDAWGKKYHLEFYSRIPYDNETRRNLGYLRALEDGCKVLISIDDDNFPTDDDFVGGHASSTGKSWDGEMLSEKSGFYNICEHLVFQPSRQIFPRGYPFALRGGKNTAKKIPAPKGAIIGVTAGLWLVEPDIDATTWLNGKVKGVGYRGKKINVLDGKTWTPLNTQNTSVTRELVPAFLCIPMGWAVPGGKIQRYGDIWGGYFLQAVMKGTKHHVAFGRPLVNHHRNPHSYIDDLRHEFWGLVLTEWLIDMLRVRFRPNKRDILGRVSELGKFLVDEAVHELPAWCPPEMKAFLLHTGESVEVWSKACERAMKRLS